MLRIADRSKSLRPLINRADDVSDSGECCLLDQQSQAYNGSRKRQDFTDVPGRNAKLPEWLKQSRDCKKRTKNNE